jgi:hypothetical protein
MRRKNAMRKNDPGFFHKLYGARQSRIRYSDRDFLDYLLMVLLSAVVVSLSYGAGHVMSALGLALCGFALVAFVLRHGVELRVPAIVRRPQDALYMLAYKAGNLRPMYFIALGLLLLENALIAATPNLPHHVGLTRAVAFGLFYAHFLSITAYRTAILVGHLAKRELVREVLMQTPWKRVVNEKTNITLEIVHAYCTGLLTHLILIAPWYLVISYFNFSVIFLLPACLVNVAVHKWWIKSLNAWFYRDHWLGHNSEIEFLYLHGTHHDAIPSGMIAVAENGFLEGFLRFTVGAPASFYNPLIAFAFFTMDIKFDMDLHQYIPGVFPKMPRKWMEIAQHSTHHYGLLAPYSIGMKLDQPGVSEDMKKANGRFPDEVTNSIRLDEELTGFKWDNPIQRTILGLYDKYQK